MNNWWTIHLLNYNFFKFYIILLIWSEKWKEASIIYKYLYLYIYEIYKSFSTDISLKKLSESKIFILFLLLSEKFHFHYDQNTNEMTKGIYIYIYMYTYKKWLLLVHEWSKILIKILSFFKKEMIFKIIKKYCIENEKNIVVLFIW